jgi:hypothetical protein
LQWRWGEVVSRGLLETRGSTAEPLGLAEAAFDEIAPGTEVLSNGCSNTRGGLFGNDGEEPFLIDYLAELINISADDFDGNFISERADLRHIAFPAGGEGKTPPGIRTVNHKVDLCAQPPRLDVLDLGRNRFPASEC